MESEVIMCVFFYKTDIGEIAIQENEGSICAMYFEGEALPSDLDIIETQILKEAAYQLDKYLKGELKEFSLPLKLLTGTDFMKEIWQVLKEIPYGQTYTYKQVAEKINRPKAARAVGLACNRNPIPIFIPCHRVIGSNGSLTGYLGGVHIKEKLLSLERKGTILK